MHQRKSASCFPKRSKSYFQRALTYFFATKPVVRVGSKEELLVGAGVDAGEGGGARVPESSLPLAFHGETYMS